MADIPALYADAAQAWHGTQARYPGDRDAPRGAPVYWTGGSNNDGHIAVSLGDGLIRSTDADGPGRIATVELGWVETHWGLTYAGWARDINGVTIPGIGGTDMELSDPISEWSPDDGPSGDTTVGKTLNQARGYAEDTYQRVKALEDTVAKIAKALGVK
jgi:hypothetical protein